MAVELSPQSYSGPGQYASVGNWQFKNGYLPGSYGTGPKSQFWWDPQTGGITYTMPPGWVPTPDNGGDEYNAFTGTTPEPPSPFIGPPYNPTNPGTTKVHVPYDPANPSGANPLIGLPPPGTTPTNPAVPTSGTASVANMFDPFTAFLQQLGLGAKNYLSPLEQYQSSMYKPLSLLQTVLAKLSTDPTTGATNMPATFGEFAMPYVQGAQDIGAQARSMLLRALALGAEGQGTRGMSYTPEFAGGEMTGRGGVDELQQLLYQALRGPMGNTAAKWLSGDQKLINEQQQWANQAAAQGASGGTNSFLTYLAQKYNLGALLGQ